jgi:O-antigen/teichoic acid export membrane protein
MVTGLLSARYVLLALGASDFGLYNVVGGVVSMLSFIASSMTSTTTRFINYEEGKKDGDTNLIFNVCLVVHVIAALIFLVVAETMGILYINNYLNVEAGKEYDAHFVFQVATFLFCLTLVNVPYQGLIIAKEKFGMMAIVDIVNSIMKLLLVLLLFLYRGNVLLAYAIMMGLLTLITFITYHLYCFKKWPIIVKHNIKKTKGHYKEVISYNNYNILGTSSLTFRSQGSNMIINYFFGTTINASYAIAKAVQDYVNMFTANFDVAAGPQITQNYSGGKIEKSEHIAGLIGRFTMLTMEIAFFPLIVELEFLLKQWLGELPEGTLIFTQLTLVLVFVGATASGMTRMISASGKIKWFEIQFSVLYMLCLPISFYLYKQGAPPATIILLFVISEILSRFNQLVLLHKIVGFDSFKFMKEAYVRPFWVAMFMFIFILLLKIIMPNGNLCSILNIALTSLSVIAIVFGFGLKTPERKKIVNIIVDKIHYGKSN